MKKVFLSAVICLSVHIAAFSQTGTEKRSAFQLSFVYPLGTNGMDSYEYTNGVSFNILAGVSNNEEYFTFGGLANIVRNNANGFQFAGIWNHVGNNGRGMLFAGIANTVVSDYTGLQFAGIWNSVSDMGGLQFSGLINNVGSMSGVQFAGLANISGEISGFQFAGLFNMVRNVSGFQFAGLMNIARYVSGVQFAGLINIARSSDYPIGIINIIRTGEIGIAATYNETGSAMLTLRSGGRVTYGIIGAGYNHKSEKGSFVTEAGLGAHINCTSWLRIKNEIKIENISDFSDSNTFKTGYSFLPAFRIANHLELFGGVSINYMQSDDPVNRAMFPKHSIWKDHTDTRLRQAFVGYQVGIQFIL